MKIDLSGFDNSWYDPGRGPVCRAIWLFINVIILNNPLFLSSRLKAAVLRLFGAKIGVGVVLKPFISVKYPWNLEIGDYSWIGEGVWLDSLARISIGNNCCVSQGAYFCTGNHDWSDPSFGLVVKPIVLRDGAWVGAKSIVLPGVTMESHAVLGAGSVLACNTEPFAIYGGNPAVKIKERVVRQS